MDITNAVAASRMAAQLRAIEVTAGNLANTNTPGFRAERMQFSDWLSRQPNAAMRGPASVAYAQDRATWREAAPGPLSFTGNPYDLALTGDGYFTVSTPAGPRLTRDGRFGPMPDGTLADAAGHALLGANGQPIQLTPTDTGVVIAGDGTISGPSGLIGRVGVVRPDDRMRLTAEGGTLFRADTPTTPVPSPGLTQGAVEESNVQPVLELTRMMNDERAFQTMTQFIQAESDRQQSAIDKLLPKEA